MDFTSGTMGRDIQQAAPEGERVVPLVLREGTFPLIGGVTRNYLLQMEHDGSSPTLHDLSSPRRWTTLPNRTRKSSNGCAT